MEKRLIKLFIVDDCEFFKHTLDEIIMFDRETELTDEEIEELNALEIGEEWMQDMGEAPIKRVQ
jgi:hypothetical protein